MNQTPRSWQRTTKAACGLLAAWSALFAGLTAQGQHQAPRPAQPVYQVGQPQGQPQQRQVRKVSPQQGQPQQGQPVQQAQHQQVQYQQGPQHPNSGQVVYPTQGVMQQQPRRLQASPTGLRGKLFPTAQNAQQPYYSNESEQPWIDSPGMVDQDSPPVYHDGQVVHHGGQVMHDGAPCASCGGGPGYLDSCDQCDQWIRPDDCGYGCYDFCGGGGCDDFCRNWCWTQDLTFFGGFQGFKGPLDQGMNGNFGANYGVNWGMPLWHRFGLGFQAGYRGVTSNFHGDPLNPDPDQSRQQDFVTLGVFHRLSWRSHCWQWGVVADVVSDDYYVNTSVNQVRAELSRFVDHHEIGFTGSFAQKSEETGVNNVTGVYEAVDQYKFFLRERFAGGSEFRFWGGVTGDRDGLIGGDFDMFLSDYVGLYCNVNYLIPDETAVMNGQDGEAWNLSINFVLYPGATGRRAPNSRYRPLFHVADNNSFITRRTQ